MVIDTLNEELMEEYEWKKEKLSQEKLAKGQYDSSDLALVRTTDVLPLEDRIVPAIANTPFVVKRNGSVIKLVAEDIILKSKNENIPYDEIVDIQTQAKEDYTPLSTQYRSTVHFCLNGAVPDLGQSGDFLGQYAIIDPFKYHEHDENIYAVRPEDTYFKEGINLSKEAVILVPEAETSKEEVMQLVNNYNVIFYRGSKQKAVECVLVDMGIVPEKVETHNIANSSTYNLVHDFINRNNYPTDKHSLSKSYKEDDMKNPALWTLYDEEFYKYLFDIVYPNNDHEADLQVLFNYANYWHCNVAEQFARTDQAKEVIKNIIELIGLENMKKLVANFNAMVKERVQSGNYPTNNEILAGAKLHLVEGENNRHE